MNRKELKEILAERYRSKRRLGIKVDARGSSEQTDIESGLAEYYAAKKLGCDFNYSVTNTGDGGYDFIYKNKKVDVKWLGKLNGTDTPRKSGRIIVDLHKINDADIYLAVSGSEKIGFKIVGWCTREDLKNEPFWISKYPDVHGFYKRYAIHTDKIRKTKKGKRT